MSKLAPWLTDPVLAKKTAAFAMEALAKLTSVRDVDGHVRVRPMSEVRILEPSAGEGALIEALVEAGVPISSITAVELHTGRVRHLRRAWPGLRVIHRDFLSWIEDLYEDGGPTDPPFDLAVMNPPYDDGQDSEHVEAASIAARDVVAIVRSAFRHGSTDRARLFAECSLIRERILKARPSFIDAEEGKDGTPRHEFEVVHLRRRLGREPGFSRETHPVDFVETGWW